MMEYRFKYQTTAFDFWQLSMYYTYGSMVGVCNIIFTIAMFGLLIRFGGDASIWIRIFLVFACCLFTVIQPIAVYSRAKRQVAKLPKDIEITFDDQGIHVKGQNKISHVKWNTIKKISKKPNMMVIFSTTTHGFLLTNKILGSQKEEFYEYVISKSKCKKDSN